MTTTAQTSSSAEPLAQAQRLLDARPLGHVIDGRIDSGSGGEQLEVVYPATGEVIARIPSGDATDVDRAVRSARSALPAWKARPPAERSATLMAVAQILDDHTDELTALESLNTGKPFSVSAGEIPGASDVFRLMAGAARALQSPATDEYVGGHVSMIRREPCGVIGAITPWNYPLLTAVWKIASALAVGNTMVLKPSELTPLTVLRFMDLVRDTLPPGVLNVVLGTGPAVGSALSCHPDIDLVTLTGSVESGRRVVSDSATTLKATHLELGGKAPVVVFDDADLDLVAAGVRFAGYWNTGQECGAGTRLLCAESIREELTQKIVQAVSTIAVGPPDQGDAVEMGPLISAAQRDRVHAAVSRAKDAGATIAFGGTPVDGEGFFYTPTVVTEIPDGDPITTHEIFGPVVTIEGFQTEEEVIERANDVQYGLSASVWTSNIARAFRVSSALDFGTVWVNSHLVVANEMPWGGYGASGHGRELSTLSLDDFSRTKHVMVAIGAE